MYRIDLLLRVGPLQLHIPLRPLDVHLAEVGTSVLLRLQEVDMEEMGRSIRRHPTKTSARTLRVDILEEPLLL